MVKQRVSAIREVMTRIKQKFGTGDNSVTIQISEVQAVVSNPNRPGLYTEERDLDLVTRLLEDSNYLNDQEFDVKNRVFVRHVRVDLEEEKETFFINVMETVFATLEATLQQEDPQRTPEDALAIFRIFIHLQKFINAGVMTIKPVLRTGLEDPLKPDQVVSLSIEPEKFALLRSWNGIERRIGDNIREINFPNGFKVVLEKFDESHVMIKSDITQMIGLKDRLKQLEELYRQKLITPMDQPSI